MDRFVKKGGKLFLFINIAIASMLMVYACVYSTQFGEATNSIISTWYLAQQAFDYYKYINDMVFKMAGLAFLGLIISSIINIYNRRHFQLFHLIVGVVTIVAPLPMVIYASLFNTTARDLFIPYVNELTEFRNGKFNSAFGVGTAFADFIYVIIILYVVGATLDILYLVARYKFEQRNNAVALNSDVESEVI